MKYFSFSYQWKYYCSSTPEQLWPLISDTNRFFKDMGQLSVQQASLSHSKKRGYKELTYEHLHRIDIWEEEPYQWEAPYHYSVLRTYKHGYYDTLKFSVDIEPGENGTVVTVRFTGHAKGIAGWLFAKRKFGSRFRRKVGKIISEYDASIVNRAFPKARKKKKFFGKRSHLGALQKQLTDNSGRPEISALLIETLRDSDELDLACMHPPQLAELWNKPLHDVLEVLLYAAKINILNFSWNITCPSCRKKIQNTKKLAAITGPLFCKVCDRDAELDFNHTVQLVFQVHPLVKKLSRKVYCVGNPRSRPHVYLNQILQPGEKKYVEIMLPAGNYRFYSDRTDGYIYASVDKNGLDNATLTFHQNESHYQHVKVTPDINLVLYNQTNKPITITCEKRGWESHSVAASHVTSLQLFRNLFPRELIRTGKQVDAKNLTILFTDLINSSKIYTGSGDEPGIGQVMEHFESLRKIIMEERGAIVKTTGEAVMAIFPQPIYAMQAFERAHSFFKKSIKTDRPVQLKGGIHSGNCVAVTFNNRIDYFGKAVNIASRLSEHAKGGELVISSDAYKSDDLKELIKRKRDTLTIHHFDVSLKGFEDHSFEAKRITLQGSLRLVV